MPKVTDQQYAGAAAIRAALREFDTETDRITTKHGLTATQYELLLLIQASPEQERTINRLCQKLARRQSAVTQLTRRAEDHGLIDRQLSKQDARVRYLHLSDEGKQRLDNTLTALGAERTRLLDILSRIDHT